MQVARCFSAIPLRILYILAIAAGILTLYLGALSSGVIIFVLATCLVMLAFAAYLARWVVSKDEGTADMQEVCKRHEILLVEMLVPLTTEPC